MKVEKVLTNAPNGMPIAIKPRHIPVPSDVKDIEKKYNRSKGIGNKVDVRI